MINPEGLAILTLLLLTYILGVWVGAGTPTYYQMVSHIKEVYKELAIGRANDE
jgi:hypothetical protein